MMTNTILYYTSVTCAYGRDFTIAVEMQTYAPAGQITRTTLSYESMNSPYSINIPQDCLQSQTIISRNLCVCVCVFVCGKFPSAYIKRTVRVTGLVFSV